MKQPNKQHQYQWSMSSGYWNLVVGILLSCSTAVVNGQVPTRAPNFGNLPCVLCPSITDVITNPDTIIPGGTFDFIPNDTSCAVLATDAEAAYFRPYQCSVIIGSTVPDLCGCATPPTPTTSEATVTPSLAPVVTPPTNATNATIITTVSITLSNVSSTLNTPDLVAMYDSVVTTFLSDMLSSDTVTNITATLLDQTLLVPGNSTTTTTRVRRLRTSTSASSREAVRMLQASDNSSSSLLFPLQTDANITAIVPSSLLTDAGIELFTNALVSAISSNASDLIKAFQVADPTFFSTVQAIESSPTPTVPVPVPVAAPVAAPVEAPAPAPASDDDDDGISGGAIAGIVVAIIVVIIGGGGYAMMQEKDKSPPLSASRSSPGSNDKSLSLPQDPLSKSTKSDLSSSKVYAVQASKKAAPSLDDMITRVVEVPPGKLGVVIDTSVNGPVVKTVKPESPLEGKLFVGDIITNIDGVDVRSMSAASIVDLLLKTADNERKLTVLSANPAGSASAAPKLEDMITRDVVAPPGKIGVVIDTSLNGPVVKTIKPDSPLEGKLFVGDIITVIDGVDARAMSAASIVDLLLKTADRERKLTVLSSNPASSAAKVKAPPKLEDMTTRVVVVPPGKLGVVIDTSLNGPVVKTIKPDSPLEGKLFVGDIITDIDGVDARAMSAASIVDLLLKTASNERKLTVLSSNTTLPSAEGEPINETTVAEDTATPPAPESTTPAEDSGLAATAAVVAAGTALAAVETTSAKATSAPNLDEMTTRVVIAPPGKLGIVIDTTLNGPVVKTIKPDSPLEGKLFLGDIITVIDGVDTRAMSAASIVALLLKTAANERKLTVLSKNQASSSVAGESTKEPIIPDDTATATATENTTPVVDSGAGATTVAATSATTAGVSGADLEDMITRVVVAPPGKLGIVIDTTLKGPVVNKIKPNSPLEGKIFLGDIIVEIDGIDSRAMSASAITALMVKTAANERKLTVLSKEDNLP